MKSTQYLPGGFTVIDLIVTLLISTLLLSWGYPSFREFRNNQLLTQSINQFSAAVNFARSQSIIRAEHIVICPSTSFQHCEATGQWHQGYLVFADLNQDRQHNDQDVLLLAGEPLSSGIMAMSSRFRSAIRFTRSGFSPGTNLSIRFCDERGAEHGKALVVSQVGRPRIAQRISRCQ
ncbi:GspH/FimT family pseudopilin [Marinicella sediminis]|uniref:Type II secretion system protein H n=1 Tax=Marinicella sediminis TaxID=1792834 RepID=A0ABV7JE21_9GAMM|nr:GspH/FimT family protein [Marinicella sediminis]